MIKLFSKLGKVSCYDREVTSLSENETTELNVNNSACYEFTLVNGEMFGIKTDKDFGFDDEKLISVYEVPVDYVSSNNVYIGTFVSKDKFGNYNIGLVNIENTDDSITFSNLREDAKEFIKACSNKDKRFIIEIN